MQAVVTSPSRLPRIVNADDVQDAVNPPLLDFRNRKKRDQVMAQAMQKSGYASLAGLDAQDSSDKRRALLRQVTGVYAFQHQWPEWARLPVLSEADRGWYLGIIPNLDQLEQIIQPALVLASVSTVVVARLTRTTMLEAAGSDHVRTARAKGLKERQVLSRHTLRNALIPVVTFVGIDFGTLVGFAILTETVFGWPGLGSRVARAAGQSDLPVVLTLSMVVMALYGIANLIVDVSYAKLDPRIRLGGAR